jgi:hypothetical protein
MFNQFSIADNLQIASGRLPLSDSNPALMRVLFIGGWIPVLEWRVMMCIPSCIW